MSLRKNLSKSRGTRNLVLRIWSILARFGISSRRFKRLLTRYNVIAHRAGCVPTFPITAVTLKRHTKLIRELCQNGVEFAVHGYIHTDYGVLSFEEQVRHYKKAIDTFQKAHVPFTGFRAPFVRVNNQTFQALSNLGFRYDSSLVINWDVINQAEYSKYAWGEYERVLDFYKSQQARHYLALPRSIDGFVEIPVSMPDDEIMVERFGITDERKISEIWGAILESTYSSGELFTLQLHPERISVCEKAFLDVIQKSRGLKPPVWVATLKEIAEWWQERDSFNFEISSEDDGRYRVKAKCSDRATILIKNCKVNIDTGEWFDGYQSVTARDFILESQVRPVIGLKGDSPAAAVKFLQGEGHIVELNAKPENCGIYYGNLAHFSQNDEKALSREIEQSGAPLIRYWRWPDQARSALSVTGDIDSITLNDFILRIFENWRQNRR